MKRISLGGENMVKTKCEVYSRVVGYIRPVEQWNDGKQQEFKDRVLFEIKKEFQTRLKLGDLK